MPSTHLTDIVVSRLKEPGTYFDQTTPAFGVRVGKNRKTWIVMRGAKRIRTSVGRYPAMTLAEARKKAKILLTEPASTSSRLTFEAAYELFKTGHIDKKKARTAKEYKRLMDKHFIPSLAKKKLSEVQFEDVNGATAQLTSGERAHALTICRAFLRWCVRPPRRYIKHSPLEGLQVEIGKSRKRVLRDQELKTVWYAAEEQGYPHGYVVQLLILTLQRRGEIANLRWTWINVKERLIVLPEWICKNGIEHTIPYGDRVAAILELIPRRNSTDLLFPSWVADDRPISGWSKYKKELNELVGKSVAAWRLHDLRRNATKLAELKVSPTTVERLLNHSMGSISNKTDGLISEVAKVYNLAAYLPEMREAIAKWEGRLDTLLAR